LRIPVDHGYLEAALKLPEQAPRGAAVVCHPHPIHGGTMHTKAVYRAAQGFNDAGLVALRFNFRGVGTSTGSHDEGHGEQDDARAALDWLQEQYPHLPLVLGGFSFGSMVALSVGVEDERVEALLGLGLPVEMGAYDFSFLSDTDKPTLVVQGEQDEFGSGAAVAGILQPFGAHITLVRVPDTDHFFDGKLDALRSVVGGYYGSGPGSRLMTGV
jgi:alpha/beta superfamily hydrolase